MEWNEMKKKSNLGEWSFSLLTFPAQLRSWLYLVGGIYVIPFMGVVGAHSSSDLLFTSFFPFSFEIVAASPQTAANGKIMTEAILQS